VKIRFQADADLNQFIVVGVQRREPNIDFRTAKDAGLRGLPDFEVLEIAARDNRILVSQDFRTMPRAFGRFLGEHGSPGVFIVPQSMEFLAAIENLLMIWAASDAAEWSNRICRLPL
jgi:Domain of unknown function (DUF5615)